MNKNASFVVTLWLVASFLFVTYFYSETPSSGYMMMPLFASGNKTHPMSAAGGSSGGAEKIVDGASSGPVSPSVGGAVEGTRSPGGATRRHVLVLAYYRGGSSFAGALVSCGPGAFYMFEPLYLYRDEERVRAKILADFFACNFTFLLSVPRREPWTARIFRDSPARHVFQSGMEHGNTSLTLTHQLQAARRICLRHNVVVIKTIRFQSSGLERLHREVGGGSLRIVHVVRDPRGILSSQRSVPGGWTEESLAGVASSLCGLMEEDVRHGDTFSTRHGRGVYWRVRYEDLAANTTGMARPLGAFLGAEGRMVAAVPRFVRRHCARDDGSQYGTARVCAQQHDRWRRRLTWANVDTIQAACGALLRRLGYGVAVLPGFTPLNLT